MESAVVSHLSASHGMATNGPAEPAALPWAWSSVGTWADRCVDSDDALDHPDFAKAIAWDPGHCARRIWGHSPLQAPPESTWTFTDPASHEAARKLWLSGLALGCAIDRAVDESGLSIPWKGMDWSIILQGSLWSMAAHKPDHFRAWLATADVQERRRLEVDTLGVPADVWSQWILGRRGFDFAARALWMIKADPYAVPKTGPDASEISRLSDIVQYGVAVATASRYSLESVRYGEISPNDPRVALTEAMVKSLAARLRFEAPDDPALVSRSLSLIRQTHRAREAEAQAAAARSLLRTIDHDVRTLVGTPAVDLAPDDLETGASSTAEPPSLMPGNAEAALITTTIPETVPEIESRWRWFHGELWNRFRQWEDLAHEVGRRRVASELQAQASRFESLAEFAAGAGHELNNPLAVIQGRAQLLLARAQDDSTRSSLKAIVEQTLRAHRMLRDLIFIARPGEPRPRLFRPAESLRAIVREFKADTARRNLQVQLRLAPEIAGLELENIDPDAFRHLATSLFRNAIEASVDGGSVTLSLKLDAHVLALHVEDQGRGFDSKEARHLFDPFYCGRRAGRGLGLGLPRVARIVAQMNGKIRFRSQPGQGTVFEVIVPVTPARPIALSNTG
jgi:signal transduction histidine kinase